MTPGYRTLGFHFFNVRGEVGTEPSLQNPEVSFFDMLIYFLKQYYLEEFKCHIFSGLNTYNILKLSTQWECQHPQWCLLKLCHLFLHLQRKADVLLALYELYKIILFTLLCWCPRSFILSFQFLYCSRSVFCHSHSSRNDNHHFCASVWNEVGAVYLCLAQLVFTFSTLFLMTWIL